MEIRFRRVGITGPRSIGQVGGQALGRGESRSFADQQHDHLWIELLADVVEHTDSAVTHDERLADLPAAICSGVEQQP